MKNPLLRIFFLFVLATLISACSQPVALPGAVYNFDLKEIVQQNDITAMAKSKVFTAKVLNVSVKEGKNQVVITDGSKAIDWQKAKYLVCDLWHENNFSAIVFIDFYSKAKTPEPAAIDQQGGQSVEGTMKPRISPKIGILPRVKTRMIFPLSYLDGQQIFLNRFPRQLKGVVMGRRLDPSDIGKVALRIEPDMSPDYLTKIEIAGIWLADTVPSPLEKLSQPIVDEFGQWSAKDWEGKTKSEADLKNNLQGLESMAANASFPREWSIYGGWKQKKFKATGFFRTQNDGKRWWLVDPEGCAFLSAGIDCIRDRAEGTVTGQEDLFTWLPPKNDSLFLKAYGNQQRSRNLSVDFVQSNLVRVYGADSRTKWEQITTGLLKQWRINTIANWSDIDYARKAKIPYVLNMSRFPRASVLLYRDFPDVFSDEYARNSVDFAKQLEKFKDDRFLIGYFLSNEPQWAFGDNNLAFEMFATNTASATKQKMAGWLKNKYKGSISDFNSVWKQSIKDFGDIPAMVMKESPSAECWNDCKEFSGIMVDQYIKAVCDEVKKVDPHHLNLGMRYAWMSSELCYRAGAYFDVFSINGYSNPAPPETAEITRRSGKPVIIGEYHFGSIDRGLPATGIQGAENQQARGEAYRYYLEQGFSRPELIGIHYFQWMEPACLWTGRRRKLQHRLSRYLPASLQGTCRSGKNVA